MRSGFHSAVIRWFVMTGLDRLVLRKQLLLSQTKSLFAKKSIALIRTSHSWFTPYLCLPKPLHESMKLITRSRCLCLAQLRRRSPNAQSFPCANTHYEHHSLQSSFYSSRQANFAHFTCNIHAASENEVSWSGHLN